MNHRLNVERLALLGTLIAIFGELHPSLDQWAQNSTDASCKGLYGDHPVYPDGVPVGEETDDRTGWPTLSASELGRRSVARHVASYTAGQLVGTLAATRALGYRVPGRALLAGAAINALTHAVIDRREPLLWLAGKLGKRGYIDHCTAVRMDEDGALATEMTGPGTALMEQTRLCTGLSGWAPRWSQRGSPPEAGGRQDPLIRRWEPRPASAVTAPAERDA